ncbi:MAG: paraquat-inducible protein A [Panacagrimonas sp.]
MSAWLTGRTLRVIECPACGLVCGGAVPDGEQECPRCNWALHPRKPESIARTWALLVASVIAYIPANLLPIMHTKTLLEDRQDTIVGGVLTLWAAGSWDLAIIVFVASVVVPLAKIGILGVLLLSVQNGWLTGRRRRTRLYRLVEWVGQWSMLDIFVVVLLVALVQFSTLAKVDPGPAAVAFGAVVVLTMLAAQSFDPRLIWDAAEGSLEND